MSVRFKIENRLNPTVSERRGFRNSLAAAALEAGGLCVAFARSHKRSLSGLGIRCASKTGFVNPRASSPTGGY